MNIYNKIIKVKQVSKTLLLAWKALGLSPRPVKSNTVANSLPPLQYFFGVVLPRRQAMEMASPRRHALRANTVSILRIFLRFLSFLQVKNEIQSLPLSALTLEQIPNTTDRNIII